MSRRYRNNKGVTIVIGSFIKSVSSGLSCGDHPRASEKRWSLVLWIASGLFIRENLTKKFLIICDVPINFNVCYTRESFLENISFAFLISIFFAGKGRENNFLLKIEDSLSIVCQQ